MTQALVTEGRARRRRDLALAKPEVLCQPLGDGSLLCRAARPLERHEQSLARMFRNAAARYPDRDMLAERRSDGSWRRVTYAEARSSVDALAQGLIDRDLSPARPLMILSGNSVDHGLLVLAAHCAGIPISPISVAYSLQSQDFAKLRYISELLTPGMIYVADTGPFAKALHALDLAGVEVLATTNTAALPGAVALDDLLRTRAGQSLEARIDSIRPETIAKFLFTSGSTSLPKGVINTHGMLTANQQQIMQVWPFLEEEPPMLVDWLPWNHTFGSNHNFNLVVRHGGTLIIDGGKPVPGLIEQTVRNLREVSPTLYCNVPAGFAVLLPYLENDPELAKSFFAKLRLILYAGATLPNDLWERLERVAEQTCGEVIPMTSSWGSTETSPLATAAHFPLERAGPIGVPVPGLELKLVPAGGKYEARLRGPTVTPGYWKRPDLDAEAFDADGFYKIGDAVTFVDATNPDRGFQFDGRISEDFKLTTGTWVAVGALRVGLLAATTPALQDAVIAGENRASVCVLAWINPAGCRSLIGESAPADYQDLAAHPLVRDHVRQCLTHWNRQHPGSSTTVARVLLLSDPPSIDANEITDKGYVNQRLALDRRRQAVERLYSPDPDEGVIVVDRH